MKQPQGSQRGAGWPVILIGICGMAGVALGILVLAGWYLGNAALVRIREDLVPMQITTAISFLLSGIGLVVYALGLARLLTAVCGGLVLAIGTLISLEHLLGANLGLGLLLPHLPGLPGMPPMRSAAPTSAAFALCGANLLMLGLPVSLTVRRVATWILGSAILALALVALSGDVLGFTALFVKGAAMGVSLHTIVGLTVLSIGLLATQLLGSGRLMEDRWLPLPLGVGTMAAAVMLWQALTVERSYAIRRQAELLAGNVAADSLSRLRFSLRALELMKLRWEHRGITPYAEWQADAKASIQDEPIFEAIGRTDASWRVERVEPSYSEATPFDLDPHEERRWDAAEGLEEARTTGRMVVSPSIDLNENTRGFIAYFPLFPEGKFDGFLFGVFRLAHLTKTTAESPELADCRVSIFEGDEQIFGQAALAEGEGGIAAESQVDFYGHRWRFVVEPNRKAAAGGQMPRIVLWLGLLLGTAASAAVWAFQQVRGRNHKIRTANAQLQEEIAGREEVERELRATLLEKHSAQTLLETAGRMARMGHWELPVGSGDPQWSAVMFEIHDLPPGTPIRRSAVEEFVHPQDRELVRQAARKAIATGEIYELEVRLITAKGREIWVQMRGEPVLGEDGKVVAIHGIVQDIDERRQAAERLKEQNRQLEIATSRAEAHARAKTEFLANMSHEIRTPLNAVIGMSELLMDGELDEREREFVETIHSSGDVLLSLISDILDFSKIESGQLDLEWIPVPPRDMVESVLDLLAGEAAKKKLDLMCWVDPEVPEAVLGDPTRLRQVLVNLTGNAIKFTARGEVFLKLTVRRDDSGGSWLRVEVRDTGIGISEEGRGRLFGVFSQVDASTTRRFGGTGLGLAISQRLVQNMGGKVWVESELEKGSTFLFEIPLRPAELPDAGETVKAGAVHDLEGRRLLIVDDNATNRWILRMQAESWGMRPTVVEGARQALEMIGTGEKFDLAIIDGLMPDMDGYELAAAIRRKYPEQELPILILTSMGDLSRNWKSLGITGVLTKPVRAAALLATVRGSLRAPSVQRKTVSRQASPPGEEKPGLSRPLRILVAEDNPVNQRVVGLHLQRMGYGVHTMVGNGEEVLEAVGAAPFDVILLDVQMPVMDGLAAAREICRRFPDGGRPWMIALTANAQGGDRDECLAAGMNDYLSKPVRGESLLAALRVAFDHKNP